MMNRDLSGINISVQAKIGDPLQFSSEVLSLANRAHGTTFNARDGFDRKLKVKRYRYSFQLIHDRIVGEQKAIVLKTNPKIYNDSFVNYAKQSLASLGLAEWSDVDLEEFFTDPETKLQVNKIIICGVIRAQLGRPLEIFILLDRCLYLQENGYQVEMIKMFNEDISPRAIGIYANK